MSDSIVGPWAKHKLALLGKYLAAYTTILRKQAWCEDYCYIDAFAGPGAHEIRRKAARVTEEQLEFSEVMECARSDLEQRQFIAGSPRVALEIPHPFTSYVFIERSQRRVLALQRLKSEFGATRRIVIREEDCTSCLSEFVGETARWKNRRAIVFLDPFGMQVKWSTIEQLARTRAIEVFLNFPVGMAIQRLLPRNPTELAKGRRDMLDDYFGSTAWFKAVYKPNATLFDDDDQKKIEQSGQALLKWYSGRLKDAFGHVSKAALIRNTAGGHLYYLLLASPKAKGAQIASDIIRKFGDVV